jgi:hypothetical protein
MKIRLLMLLLLVQCELITGCATHATTDTTVHASDLAPAGAPIEQTGAVPMTGYITIDDVVRMSNAHCNPSTIIREIRTTRTVFHLSTNEILSLKNQGVSEKVINAMIESERTAYSRRGR